MFFLNKLFKNVSPILLAVLAFNLSVILLLKQKETDVYAFYEEIAEVPDSAETPQNMEDTLQPELESVD